LPQQEQNAFLHLFSFKEDQVVYGQEHYHIKSQESSTLLGRLLRYYLREGLHMPFDIKQYIEEAKRELLSDLSPEQREQWLKNLPPDQLEQWLKSLPPRERLAGLTPEDLLAQMTPEEKEKLRRLLDGDKASPDAP
jgi:hypothetical protein